MNIFEALRKGNGKAAMPWYASHIYETRDTIMAGKVVEGLLCRDDWIPYVPRETVKVKCYNCGTEDSKMMITKQGNCYACGKKIFPMPVPEKPEDDVCSEPVQIVEIELI